MEENKYIPGDWVVCLLGDYMVSGQFICYEYPPNDNLILLQKRINGVVEKFFVNINNPNFLLWRIGMDLEDLRYDENETRS